MVIKAQSRIFDALKPMEFFNALARSLNAMHNVMQFANRPLGPPKVHLFLKFLINLTIFLESVDIRPKQDGSGHEVNDVPAAPKSAVLLLEPKFTSELIKTSVVALCVVCDKVPNAAVEIIFVDDSTNPVCKVFATILALDAWQAKQKCAQLASFVNKVHG
ncbi:hypothetical protein MY5147_005394 [Beauveria neobassiana]